MRMGLVVAVLYTAVAVVKPPALMAAPISDRASVAQVMMIGLSHDLAIYVSFAETCAPEHEAGGQDLDEAYFLVERLRTELLDHNARASFDAKYVAELKSMRHILALKAERGQAPTLWEEGGEQKQCASAVQLMADRLGQMVGTVAALR